MSADENELKIFFFDSLHPLPPVTGGRGCCFVLQ